MDWEDQYNVSLKKKKTDEKKIVIKKRKYFSQK